MCTVRPAEGSEQLGAARELFREYAAAIGVDLAYQGFDDEVEGLPGAYAPPGGRLLLAWCHGALAGCVALRPLGGRSCELKRLYVRPEFRGQGVGARLARRAIEEARTAGYRQLRLDTLPTMPAARALYGQLGFHEIPAYYDTPVAGTVFYERALDPPRTVSVDLAIQRWRDVGIAVLEFNDAGVTGSLVRPERYGLRGRVDIGALADLLDSLGTAAGAAALLIHGPQGWKAADNGPTATVRLFDALAERGWPRLSAGPDDRVAVESCPTTAWRALGLAPLPSRRRASPRDIAERLAQLGAMIPLTLDAAPTYGEIQAVVAGLGGGAPVPHPPARPPGTQPRAHL